MNTSFFISPYKAEKVELLEPHHFILARTLKKRKMKAEFPIINRELKV